MTFPCQNIQQAVFSLKITIAKRKSSRLFLKDSIRSFKKFAIMDGFKFTQLNYLETQFNLISLFTHHVGIKCFLHFTPCQCNSKNFRCGERRPSMTQNGRFFPPPPYTHACPRHIFYKIVLPLVIMPLKFVIQFGHLKFSATILFKISSLVGKEIARY